MLYNCFDYLLNLPTAGQALAILLSVVKVVIEDQWIVPDSNLLALLYHISFELFEGKLDIGGLLPRKKTV